MTAAVDAGENGEEYCPPRRLEGATAALFKAGIDLLSGEEGGSVDNPLAAYPDILLDHMDLLNFQQLAAVSNDMQPAAPFLVLDPFLGLRSRTPLLLQMAVLP